MGRTVAQLLSTRGPGLSWPGAEGGAGAVGSKILHVQGQ